MSESSTGLFLALFKGAVMSTYPFLGHIRTHVPADVGVK